MSLFYYDLINTSKPLTSFSILYSNREESSFIASRRLTKIYSVVVILLISTPCNERHQLWSLHSTRHCAVRCIFYLKIQVMMIVSWKQIDCCVTVHCIFQKLLVTHWTLLVMVDKLEKLLCGPHGSAAMLPAKRWAGIASEVNLRNLLQVGNA